MHPRLDATACLVAAVVLCAGIAAYWPESVAIAARWSLGNESHGRVIVALVPLLLWLRRRDVRAQAAGWPTAAVAALVIGTLYAMLQAAHVSAYAWALLPVLLFAACGVALGAGALPLGLPLAATVFALPIWDDFLTPVLQALTAKVVGSALPLLGIPAALEGNLVHVRAGTFEIAAGCAGTRYLLASLATAVTLVVLDRLDARRALKVFGLAVALALIANWVRVVAIVAVGEATDMRSPLVAKHDAFGWYVYAAFLAVFVAGVRRIGVPEPLPHPPPSTPASSVVPARVLLALALLALPAAWVTALDRGTPRADAVPELPSRFGEWTREGGGGAAWSPRYPGARAERVDYSRDGVTLSTFVGWYVRQDAGRKLVGYPSDVAAGSHAWVRLARRPIAPGAPIPRLVELEIADPSGVRRLVWYWYVVGGRAAASTLHVKLLESLGAFGRDRTAVVVALSVECRPDCTDARRALAEGARSLVPHVPPARWPTGTRSADAARLPRADPPGRPTAGSTPGSP